MFIQFAQPIWLAAGLFFCLAAALFIRANIKRRKKALHHFASAHLLTELTRNVSLSRRRIKNILFVLGLACLFVALAHPQYGNRWVEVKRKGIDILIGVDVSKSMLVQDISPDRLSRAKLAVRDFVAKLEGDRVGLLPFAGTSFLMCPLTTDYDAFNASLDALDTSTIPKGGTDIGAAIREADTTLANEANHKIFILVTDGEDLSDDALKAAEEAKKNKMTIYTIGVGTPEGELIPVPGRGAQTFIQDKAGNFVTSKLDEKALTEIAAITGGLYVPLGSMGQGFDTIYQKKLSLVPKEEHGQRKRKVPIERFPWALGLAILLLGSDFLLTGRKSSWSLRLPFIKTANRRNKQQAAALMLLLPALLFRPASAGASDGEDFFKAGQYDQAAKYYQETLQKDPANPVLHFNLGDALYQNKEYEKSVSQFNETLKTDDLKLQAKSYYNRGNAQYFMGKTTEKTDPEHTIKLWQQALESYQASLALQPEDTEAVHNRDRVKKRLEQLQQQQKKEQKQDKQKNKDKKDKDKNKDKNKNNKDNKQKQQNKNQDKNQQGQQDKQQSKENKSDKGQQQEKKNKSEQNKSQSGADKDKTEKNKQADKGKTKQDKKKDADKKQQAEAAGQDSQQSDKKESGRKNGEMSKQDMQRRLQGKMTKEEAKNLLNSLKGEQRELNFIPQGTGAMEDNARDW